MTRRQKPELGAIRLAAVLVGSAAALGIGPAALAQQAQDRTEQATQPETAESESRTDASAEAATDDLDRARRELEAARRNLEAAAAEVARLSAETVGPVVRNLRRQFLGTGQRAMLGVAIVDAPDGAQISAVSPGGPAADAGIEIGDLVVAIDGEPLMQAGRSPSQVLIGHLSQVEPGTTVQLRLRRDGAERDVSLATREREDQIIAFDGQQRVRLAPFTNLFRVWQSDRWASMELVTLSSELGEYFGTDRGLLVVSAPDDPSLMLRDGDVILDIGGREPNSPEHAMRILGSFEPGETLRLTIMRQQQRQTLEIPVPGEVQSTNPA